MEVRAVPGGWVAHSEDRYALAKSRSEALALFMAGQAKTQARPGYEPLFQNGANPFPADIETGNSI